MIGANNVTVVVFVVLDYVETRPIDLLYKAHFTTAYILSSSYLDV